jgi:hypothetical protein
MEVRLYNINKGDSMRRIYKGIEIEYSFCGWYFAWIPKFGTIKADTMRGIKQMIRDHIDK